MSACSIDWTLVVSVLLALLGVAFWRLQMIGQRRFAVAEEAIVCFMLAKYALDDARNGASFDGEGATRTRGEDESPDDQRTLDGYYTPIERLRRYDQRFVDLEKPSLMARHHLGDAAFAAFDTLRRARHRVIVSASMLIKLHKQYVRHRIANEDTLKLMRRMEDDIWNAHIADDPLTVEVEKATAALRAICDREAATTAAFWPFRSKMHTATGTPRSSVR